MIVQASSTEAAARAVAAAGGSVTMRLPIVAGVAAVVPSSDAVRAVPGVRAVTPNEVVTVSGNLDGATTKTVSSKEYPPSVYPLETRANKLWAEGVDGRGVRIALIDTGVSPHVDLHERVVSVPDPRDPSLQAPCVNFSGESTCADSYGHGTFMAGLMVGSGATSNGAYRGMAPGAQIVSIKIAGRDGSADVSKVLAAIQWSVSFARRLDIRVINLSLGTNSTNHYRFDPLNYAVQRAWDSGLVVVVAASNRGPGATTISKPADDPLVITAGAVDDRMTSAAADDVVPLFSGRGPTAHGLAKPDIAAPGGRVISLRSPGSYVEENAPGAGIDSTYRRGSGTSMAAAIVSGATALYLQAKPNDVPDRVKYAYTSTAMSALPRDPNAVGAGVLDVYAAVRKAPVGLANQGVTLRSDASSSLDASRGDVYVTRECRPFEQMVDPHCDRVHGNRTAQDRMWDASRYVSEDEWTAAGWYESQWVLELGSSWYGSSWYGSSWYGSSWYGSEGDSGSSQYPYGVAIAGSSWYGAWG